MPKIKPLKRLGQNFLVDKTVIRKVIRAANLQKGDIVLEIGPGLGVLTKELTRGVKKVIAVEKDARMCQILKESLKNYKNLEIINGDVLKFEIIKLFKNLIPQNAGKNYKVVANLPFYITAPVIRKFLETKFPLKEMVLIVQKEVAQRICARPPRMSILAISVQFYAKPEIIDYVSKKSFWPQPKADAAILKIKPCNFRRGRASMNFEIVKAGFSHPRKQLVNNLANGLKLNKKEISSLLIKIGIKPNQRAETLTLNDWFKLTKVLK